MNVKFKTYYLQELYEYGTGVGRKPEFSVGVIKQYKRKIDILIEINNISKLRQHKGLHFEKLKGDRKGEYSIMLNKQYRLIFEQIKSDEQKIIINLLLINEISKHYE